MQHQQQKKITPSQVAKIGPKKGPYLQEFLLRPNVLQLGKTSMACDGLVDDNFGNLTILDQKPEYYIANF